MTKLPLTSILRSSAREIALLDREKILHKRRPNAVHTLIVQGVVLLDTLKTKPSQPNHGDYHDGLVLLHGKLS